MSRPFSCVLIQNRMNPGMDDSTRDLLMSGIRSIPDYPIPGVLYRDITPLLADPDLFHKAIDAMAAPFTDVTQVVVIESRGFALGAPIAFDLGVGLTLVRKAGRLPFETISESYALEYGTNTMEIHRDAIKPGERVVIVDDVLATGGTVRAAINLVERLGGVVAGVSLLIELSFLNGRAALPGYNVNSLIVY